MPRKMAFHACRRCDMPALFRLGLSAGKAEYACGECLGWLVAWCLRTLDVDAVHVRIHINPIENS